MELTNLQIRVSLHGIDPASQGASPGNHTSSSSPSSAYPAADTNPFPYLSSLVRSQDETQDFRTWTTDLELMHHYATVTCRTLPRPDEMGDIWQLQLPQIAFSHDYLMHQLLAISAAHLAHIHGSDPDSRTAYSLRATQHQNRALHRLQGVLPETNYENCAPIFLTASLLSIGAFAGLSESATQAGGKPGIDELLQVLLLIRGMHGILNGYHEALKASSIGKLIQAGQCGSSSPLLAEIMDELTTQRMLPISKDANSERIIREAMDSFIYWIRHASETVDVPELRVIMTWPTRLGDGFMTLVRARDADALRVLTCYGRMLEALGPSQWYLTGWGQCVLADINGASPYP